MKSNRVRLLGLEATYLSFKLAMNIEDIHTGQLNSFFGDLFEEIELGEIEPCLNVIFPDEKIRNEIRRRLAFYMIQHAHEIHAKQQQLFLEQCEEIKRGNFTIYNDDSSPIREIAKRFASHYGKPLFEIKKGLHTGYVTGVNVNKDIYEIRRDNLTVKQTIVKSEAEQMLGGEINALPARSRIKVEAVVHENAAINPITSHYIYRHYILEFEKMVRHTPWKTGFFGGEVVEGVAGKVPENIAEAMKECAMARQDGKYEAHFRKIARIGSNAHRSGHWDGFGLFKRCQEAKDVYEFLDKAHTKFQPVR